MPRRPPLQGQDREAAHREFDLLIDDASDLDVQNLVWYRMGDADEEQRPFPRARARRRKSLDAREQSVQARLVDHASDVYGTDTQRITEAIAGCDVEDYLRVPGLDLMHRAMGFTPNEQTDAVEYQAARDALFAKLPEQTIALTSLIFTQPRVKLDCGCPDQQTRLTVPVHVIKDGDGYFLLNGHQRVVTRHATGERTVQARVFDPDVPPAAVTRKDFRHALYLLMTDQSESERTFTEAERLATLETYLPQR